MTLFYVMGASGAGKDSILSAARELLRNKPFAFSHRYITRPAHAGGENHIALSPHEFAVRHSLGLFALNWESHGNSYAIGKEIDDWLNAGLNVIVSGSREYFPIALSRYPDLIPLLVTVDRKILEHRLKARGRESQTQIAQRLARSSQFSPHHPRLHIIPNNGSLKNAVHTFVTLCRRLGSPAPQPLTQYRTR